MIIGSDRRRVAVVDDDANLNEMLHTALEFAGYEVRGAATASSGMQLVASFRPDVVVLDVNLPDFDGFEVCRRLRQSGDDTPIVFLTAREQGDDVIRGLRVGGDDYVTKPFQLGELSLRLAAILRRTGQRRDTSVRFGPIAIDQERHEVTLDSVRIDLTPREFAILEYLVINRERIVTKGQIADAITGVSGVNDDRFVETYVSRLRTKFGKHNTLIRTVHRIGYVLRLPGAD